VDDIDRIAYNKRRQSIVNQTQNRKIIDIDNIILCTIEEKVAGTREEN